MLLALAAARFVPGMHPGPSSWVERPAPAFTLPLLAQPLQTFEPADMRGEVWVLNVWASWCGPCRDEHPVLLELARSRVAPLVGINYKDRPGEARAWLRQLGDPFRVSVTDASGTASADYAARGIPRTWVIDRQGVIRHERTGALTREALEREILPLVRRLQQ